MDSNRICNSGDNIQGGATVSEQRKKPAVRDYSKPIMPNFSGKEGYRAFVEIVTTPPKKYDAQEAAREAAEKLQKQGLSV